MTGSKQIKQTKDVRDIALSILLSVLEKKEKEQLTLNQALYPYRDLPLQDRVFLTRLVNESLKHLLTIDSVINHYSKKKSDKLKPVVRNVLRLAICQILYFDAVPDRAAVSEAVRITGARGLSGLKPFVNGVLRSFLRDGGKLLLPNRDEDPIAYLSAAYSMPLWIVTRFAQEYGEKDCETILSGMEEERDLSLRVNLTNTSVSDLIMRLEDIGVEVKPDRYLPEVISVRNIQSLTKLPGFKEGDFFVQDTASAIVGHISGIKPGDQCLDLCAAPGGKTIHLADFGGIVTSCDRTKEKIALILENQKRSGFSNIHAMVQDSRIRRAEWKETFDFVLADLPCSGLGVMGRKYDIRYHLTPSMIEELQAIQRELLQAAMTYVKPGGTLLFSTCTIGREENDANADFIEESGIFEPIDLTGRIPETFLQDAKEAPDGGSSLQNGRVQILPGFFSCDGFYMALFRRK